MVAQIFSYENYTLTFYALPNIFTGVLISFIALNAIIRMQASKVSSRFCFFSLSISIWLLGLAAAYCAHTQAIALFWNAVGLLGVICVPVTIFSFISAIRQKKPSRLIGYSIYMVTAVTAVMLCIGDQVMQGNRLFFWGYYPQLGSLGVLFMFFFIVIMGYNLLLFWTEYRSTTVLRHKKRMKYLFGAFAIGNIAILDFLGCIGVSWYPFGYFPILVLTLIAAYVIIRYNLTDILRSATGKIIETMQDGIVVIDLEKKIQVVNQFLIDRLGLHEMQLLKRDIADILQLPAAFYEFEVLRQAPIRDYETILTGKTGKPVEVNISASTVVDSYNDSVGLVFVLQDISFRKQIERQLVQEKQKAVGAREKMQESINTISRMISDVERAKEESLASFVPLDNPYIPNCWQEKSCDSFLCPAHGKQNVRCWQLVGTYCGGKIQGGFAKKLDDCKECVVYKQSTSEQIYEIHETFNNIIFMLAGSQEKLMHASREAQEASKLKSAFLANMSHEIRTPLNGILGMSELCLATELTDDQRKFLDLVYSEGTALLSLINEILDFSKIEADKLELEEIPFNLEYLIDDLSHIFHLTAKQKGVELSAGLVGKIPVHLIGDPGRLRQIFANLVSNSIKFTPEGGRIEVKGEVAKETDAKVTLKFSVSDTGIGIPKDKQIVIFESFSQADGSTTRKYGGTGLGTTISKRLSEAMGGDISVESDGKSGSTFTFTVVLGKQQDQKQKTFRDADLSGLEVLVVDDNSANREELREDFESFGCRVAEAEGGREALDLLGKIPDAGVTCGLIVTGLQMIMMDGFDFAAAVKAMPGLDRVPIIALVSAGSRGDGRKCVDIGINAYLTRPIDRQGLRAIVMMVLRNTHELITKYHLKGKRIAYDDKENIRLLLVEDYPTNQQVALRHLENAGYTVDLAENGRLAVEACKGQSYSLILMDIQMPLMDGYEATAVIRKREESMSSRIPIIAMTAHAMKGDREKCLAAGMDDYLSKPLRRKELLAMVEKWAMVISVSEEEPVTGLAEPAVEQINGKVMNLDKAVEEFEGDKEFLVEILHGFIGNVRMQCGTIQQAIAANDGEAVRREAHSIKGGAANLTAESLRSVAFELENIGSSGDLTEALATLSRLQKEFGRLDDFARSIS